MAQFTPPPNSTGGSSLGNSYLKLWASCPRLWYYTYYRPTPVGRGLTPLQTSPNLLIGSLFHEGLEAWYASGVRDGEDTGEYDLGAALLKVDEHMPTQDYDNLEQAREALELVQGMLRTYHNTYGPSAHSCDYPNLRIATDHEGQPLLERDFEFELAPGYRYTGRLDGICWYNGLLYVLEHKTAGIRSVSGRLRSLSTDSQFAGEQWLLQQAFPNINIDGTLVNVILKDWGGPTTKSGAPSKFSHIAVRETTRRTSAQLEQWRLDAVSILVGIDEAIAGFEAAIQDGVPLQWAEARWFPVRGTRNGHCHAYNRECDFFAMCLAPGAHVRTISQYTQKEDPR